MKSKKTGFAFVFLLLCHMLQSQNKNDILLYNTFDNAVGLKNLGINNGTIHLDPFRHYDKSHRYYVTDNYITGDVIYDGEPYSNENVKYDIFKDVLVAKVNGQNNAVGVNLIPNKTQSFGFNGKKFVNLGLHPKAPDFIKGFYEEYSGDKISLYIKYHKDQIDVLTVEGVFYKYEITTDFFVGYNDTFYKIKDDRSLAELLPAFRNKIEEYAQMSHDLEKSDRIQYMKNMIKYVNNLLITETK